MAVTMNIPVHHYYKMNKCERSKSPTKLDLQETRNLLYDFGIYATIPDLQTRSQLYDWRRAVIKGKLG